MFKLDNPVRPYSWGSVTAMADLFRRAPSGSPEAEMWIGAHPGSPSIAEAPDGSILPLDELISSSPTALLGSQTAEVFSGRLPFLAKILAAGSPLSLQVHPNLEQARNGFKAENEAGLPLSSEHRNYKDANHKPEMIVALSPFDALCGFRSPAVARELFLELGSHFSHRGASTPEPIRITAELLGEEDTGLREGLSYLLAGDHLVAEAVAASVELLAGLPSVRAEFSALVGLGRAYPGDPGVLISLLLNHVSLQPGSAIYLPAGNVHAYLAGVGFEVMASSDNVLRGGLTSKHVDVAEFLKTVDFRTMDTPRLEAQEPAAGIKRWVPPFREFQVERIEANAQAGAVPLNQNGPVLVLAIEGQGDVSIPGASLKLSAGESAFVPANAQSLTLQAAGGASPPFVAFAVTVGKAAV